MKTKKILKTVLNVLCVLLVVALVAVSAFIVYCKMQNRPAFFFGYSTFWVETPSMEDLIPARSYILVEKIDGENVSEGDVITFVSDDPALGGAFNTHRIIGINEETGKFITKGDHNVAVDKFEVSPEKVVGRYVRNLPFLSLIGRVLFSGYGIFVVGAFILLTGALLFLPELLRKNEKEDNKEEEEKDDARKALIASEIEKLKAAEKAQKEAESASEEISAGPETDKKE